jgi:hypothetical protein
MIYALPSGICQRNAGAGCKRYQARWLLAVFPQCAIFSDCGNDDDGMHGLGWMPSLSEGLAASSQKRNPVVAFPDLNPLAPNFEACRTTRNG